MRCRFCGSRNIAFIDKKEGYSMTKGIVGTAILGPVGAIAGINGKTNKVYHCSACGNDASTPMSNDEEAALNRAMKENNTFMLEKVYKPRYHNIEWTKPNAVASDNIAQKSR